MNSYYTIFLTIGLSLSSMVVLATEGEKIKEQNVINQVKQAEIYIQQKGKHKAIDEFKKNASVIFAIDFNGTVLASPLHPETVGTNQITYKDL